MKEGQKIGKLTLIRKTEKRSKLNGIKSTKWLCKCDCGNEKIISEPHLYEKYCNSCGCREYKNKSYLNRDDYLEIMKQKINNNCSLNMDNCWIWNGSKSKQGYGNIVFRRKVELVHRVSWLLHKGEIEKGKLILHKCDLPACCNPDHLFLGSQKDNISDCIKKGRFNPRGIKK